MIANTLGTAILNGSTTPASFAGLPLLGCCNDYTAGNVAAPLLDFANSLGAPAIITDVVHDGAASTPVLVLALQRYSAFFAGYPRSGPSLNGDGSTAALCGPILTLSTPTVKSQSNKSTAETQALRGFKRNHKLGFGTQALMPVVGENMDRVQRPPVYLDRFTVFGAGGLQLAQYSNGVDGAYASGDFRAMPYWQILQAVWQRGDWTLSSTQNLWQALPESSQAAAVLGLAALGTGHGLQTRQFLPNLAPLLLLYNYVGGGTFQFTLSPTVATWPSGGFLGISSDGFAHTVPATVPADGEIFGLAVQGLGNIGGATSVTLYRSPGGITPYLPFYAATPVVAALSGSAGADPVNVLRVNRGDLLILKISASWTCNGASASLQYRPLKRTVLGVLV